MDRTFIFRWMLREARRALRGNAGASVETFNRGAAPPLWSPYGFAKHPFGALRKAFRASEAALTCRSFRIIENMATPRRPVGAWLLDATGSRTAALARLAQWGSWPVAWGGRTELNAHERASLRAYALARVAFDRRCDRIGRVIESQHPRWWQALMVEAGSSAEALSILDLTWLEWPYYPVQVRYEHRRTALSGFQILAWDGTSHLTMLHQKYLARRRHALQPPAPPAWLSRDGGTSQAAGVH